MEAWVEIKLLDVCVLLSVSYRSSFMAKHRILSPKGLFQTKIHSTFTTICIIYYAMPSILSLEATAKSQCLHLHSDLDIIAIKHEFCNFYYACISLQTPSVLISLLRWELEKILPHLPWCLCSRCNHRNESDMRWSRSEWLDELNVVSYPAFPHFRSVVVYWAFAGYINRIAGTQYIDGRYSSSMWNSLP